jgi:hypothetical protein
MKDLIKDKKKLGYSPLDDLTPDIEKVAKKY